MSFSARRRPRKIDQFAQISNDFLRDKKLSIEARGVGAYLMTNDPGFVVSSASLMAVSGLGRDKLRRVLGELETEGYLERERSRDVGRFGEIQFLMSDEKPSSEPVTEEPSPVGQALVTNTHKNTNSENTRKEETSQDLPDTSGDDALFDAPAPSSKAAGKPTVPELDAEFAAWYVLYPRKVSKGQGLAAYRRARRMGTTAETMLDGVTEYARRVARDRVEKTFIKHPATWLNGQCWADEDAGPRTDGGATGTTYRPDAWDAQRAAEKDADGLTAEDRAVQDKYGATVSYG